MSNSEEQRKKYLEILKLFEETLGESFWSESVFLQAIRKKFDDIKEKFKLDTNLSDVDLYNVSQDEHSLFKKIASEKGMQEVFVLLYNADGYNVSKWENLLNSIEKQAINRPTYKIEDFAKSALRNAPQKFNEAYVSIFVKNNDVLESSFLTDRFDNALITLKDSAIHKDNIFQFVHKTGIYEFENNKLIWQEEVDFF